MFEAQPCRNSHFLSPAVGVPTKKGLPRPPKGKSCSWVWEGLGGIRCHCWQIFSLADLPCVSFKPMNFCSFHRTCHDCRPSCPWVGHQGWRELQGPDVSTGSITGGYLIFLSGSACSVGALTFSWQVLVTLFLRHVLLITPRWLRTSCQVVPVSPAE